MSAKPAEAIENGAAEHELGDFSTDRRVLLLSLMAVVIGVMGAFVAWILLWLIAVVTNIAFLHRFSSLPVNIEELKPGLWVILIPAIGSLIIGLMARYGSEKIRGHGIPEALEAILLGRSRIEAKVAILKPLSSAISIGTGGPFGAEGPIIMSGGALGSLFAQCFHLTAAERKVLLVAGATAGMAAIFATPVAAILFAVELLLFEWKPRSFIPVAVAAIIGAVLRVPLLGSGPVFPVTAHAAPGGWVLLAAAGVGIAAGFFSGALTKLVYSAEDFFEKIPIHWMWWPAIGGLCVGVGGLIDPRVLGVGYENIRLLLQGNLTGNSAIMLLVGKSLVWALALGSGTSGGVLAPLLIMGGCLGAVVSPVLHMGDSGLWATIGMAAMMGGTMRAPLTASIFALELTQDYQLLSPLMVASVCAMGVTVLLMKRSILTEKLARRGQHVTREYAVDTFALMRVRDVMDQQPPTVLGSIRVSELVQRLVDGEAELSRRQGTLIVDDQGLLLGIITRGDLVRAVQKDPTAESTVAEIASRDLIVTYADETLQNALHKMIRHGIGRLPVVTREDPRKIAGYLGRASILSARMKLYHEEHVRERGALSKVFTMIGKEKAETRA
jgi:CIC family chloride channel protein